MRLVLFLMLATSAWGQSLVQTRSLADSLYAQKNFEQAIPLYTRVLYFDASDQYSKSIYPKIANAYFAERNLGQASTYYDLAYNSSLDIVAKNDFTLKKISCSLALRQLEYAELELLGLDSLTEKQELEKNALHGILKFTQADFKESERYFTMAATDTALVKNIFDKNEKINKINPHKAKVLSMILPGMGQLYVGDVKNGLNSLILTTGLLALGIRGAIINNPLDAGLATLPWFQRYYQGGFKKAEIIAKAKIEQKRYAVYLDLLGTIKK